MMAVILCRNKITALMRSTSFWSASGYATVALCLQYALAHVHKASRPRRTVSNRPKPPLAPQIFPCHTTHARLFPTRHSFTYSYLLVGVPVGWQHDAGLLSCDPSPGNKSRSWFSVHAEDYLARGGYQGGLRSKLNHFLLQHGVQPDVYPYAYLVTAPRFLGWNFNPVSFWYLYDQQKKLTAMILEVNNTFDERRMYLLQPSSSTKGDRFGQKWQKDFHVSPFNDRLGDYSLLACDPFESEAVSPAIDNTITLLSTSPDAKAKIVARVYSTSSSLHPENMSTLQTTLFMAGWCWIGFLTNPRILREARILWVKKMKVFYRPEVNIGSIGRQETAEEITLEGVFKDWLSSLAVRKRLRIRYVSAAGPSRGQQVFLGGAGDSGEAVQDVQNLDIEVLTPEWYSELARTRDIFEAFDARCFSAVEGEGMVNMSKNGQELLKSALKDSTLTGAVPASHLAVLADRLAGGSNLLATALQILPKMVLGRRSYLPQRTGGSNGLFGNALVSRPEVASARLNILLADHLALGFTGLLKLYGRIVWVGIVFLTARQYRSLILGQ